MATALLFAQPAIAQSEDIDAVPEMSVEETVLNIDVEPQAAKKEAVGWTNEQALQLLYYVENIGAAGLNPADYEPEKLRAAMEAGDAAALSDVASATFARVAVHLRDGRTPASARKSWYIRDGDADYLLTDWLLEQAMKSGNIAAALDAVEPTHPQYAKLKEALAATPASQTDKIQKIRANLERWRWLPRQLGDKFILVNVPAYRAQLVEDGEVIRTHKVIVGAKRTPTPQLDTKAQGVIMNPSWYVPQSILREGLGRTIRNSPATARAKGYDWSISNGTIYARQLPGPRNALGLMKLDMPNPHAIFMHDTPAKQLFDREVRAFSHGCIRTHKALQLAGFLGVRYGGKSSDELVAIAKSGKTTRVEFAEPLPVFISYFTAEVGDDGNLVMYSDLYGRDGAVIASLGEPAEPHILAEPVL